MTDALALAHFGYLVYYIDENFRNGDIAEL